MFEEILNFKSSNEWLEFENYYNDSGILGQLDFFRFEDLQTNFLSSLLKTDNIYGLKDYPLRQFLELLVCKKQDCLNSNINLLDSYTLSGVDVQKQKVLKCGRLDLFVDFKINDKPHVIVLENKLFSSEGEEQCKKYKEEIDNLYNDYDKIYVYLSLDDNPKLSTDNDNDYIKITYQDIVDKLLEPCSIKAKKSNATFRINEYLKGFNYLYELDEISSIPLTREGQRLSFDVWNQHKDFWKLLLENDEYFNSFYKTNEKLLRILFINLCKKNVSLSLKEKIEQQKILKVKNKFDGESYSNGDLVYELLKDIISNKNIKSLDELPECLLISGNWRVIIPSSEINQEPRKDYYRLNKKNQEPIKIGDQEFYYCYAVSKEELNRFVELVIINYPEYNDRIKLDCID